MSKVETRVIVQNIGMVAADRLRVGDSAVVGNSVATLKSAKFRGDDHRFVELHFVFYGRGEHGSVTEHAQTQVVPRHREYPCVNVTGVGVAL